MSGGGYDQPDDYVDVAERARIFFEKYPEGSLRPLNPDEPFRFVTLPEEEAARWSAQYNPNGKGSKWAKWQPTVFVVYTAAAYRSPDDPAPGVGIAMEPFPGLTPYTHNSELMNAETSAWGRAIVAVGAAEARASANEIRNRREEQDAPPPDPRTIALDALKAEVEMLPEGPENGRWIEWKAAHEGWQRDVDTIREAAIEVGRMLAEAGVEPFGSVSGPDTPAEGPEDDTEAPTAAQPISEWLESVVLEDADETELIRICEHYGIDVPADMTSTAMVAAILAHRAEGES